MKSVNRRNFLKMSGATLIGLTCGSVALRSQAQELLQTSDPTAQALKYVPKSEVAGSMCSNCMYIQGNEGDENRPCAIFPGKLVAADGWCSAWVKRPG
ncbi:high-potential iron-sulfur protein [Alteromonas sp. KUL49]|uniref:high-potential iron-sulfur protein n=1 Tax=Alteromonas sp. KUL49 TaxID=2480798 RepID=UPI00102EFA17|nr:high-potential iron-sulfur protein [Alteromonas sp. KUL49]TAP42228.1 twin-arginine translocation signal domain-containing protein [Alteromonas sp. KUL49]GEA09817.1 high-potential iron-sulfur protein [Alteromonas sp. KUL49]